ncbi:T9SS type A sorting domain-containing protein [Chryseolinea lacunae]|uniref:T9SS type A sorting domain-containing protein n=1 Tax=Chryseolinea lacunae TaxID=2801331 RepID=A0ABS1L0P8_9BACT|nr:T9SS type A sorting domain-containing protein [Chryseolinea lacunae]MBL0745274.1 T9SS type A sorting domain-containing protein [Chryseolinea lacunae]
MIKFYSVAWLLLIATVSLGQGKLVLVGGGSEEEGGWSDTPYAWIVSEAANKKVAVISYTDEDNFIPDYFISLGAAEARNIKIDTRAVADLQATYDALMTYDAFFFKGGDQSQYYTLYKDTKTMQAVIDKFGAGGVMSGTSAGMAILSKVFYTAVKGSVYPDEALQDVFGKDMTLADDFLPLFPGFLFDTHFTERGRMGRLMPLMARWFLDHGELLTGIGVDDRTAMCIDAAKTGEVFGTGTVSIFNSQTFSVDQKDKPGADSVHVVQLLHGHRIDLSSGQIVKGPTDLLPPQPRRETGNYQVALSGSEGVSTNTELLQYLVKETGLVADTVVVVTAPGKAKPFIQKIQDLGGRTLLVETSAPFNDTEQRDLRNAIRRARKILFVENDDDALFNFLANGPTGLLLSSHMRRNGMITAFAGEDSRYAGKSFVTNHLTDQYAAYYGRLNFRKGLRLLPSSIVMSNTFDLNTSDYYENTTASVSYAMVADSTAFGIYLNRNGCLKFSQTAGRNVFKAKGDLSAIILVNRGTTAALASQPVSAGKAARNYAGFTSMRLVMLNNNNTFDAGVPMPTVDAPYVFENLVVGTAPDLNRPSLKVFPNPSANGIFSLLWNVAPPGKVELSVVDAMGRTLVQEKRLMEDENVVNVSALPDGVYLLRVNTGTGIVTHKVMKQP